MADQKLVTKEQILEQDAQKRLDVPPERLSTLVSIEMWGKLTYEQRGILLDIDTLPKRLYGVVPESVWSTLNVQQKLEFLFSHEILPKGEGSTLTVAGRPEFEQFVDQVEGNIGSTSPDKQHEKAQVPGGEVLINQRSEVEKRFDALKERVQQVELAEDETSVQSPEDVKRIQDESGATFTNNMNVPRLAGYQPSQQFLRTVQVSSQGDPDSSKTWAANIILKIWAAFNQS